MEKVWLGHIDPKINSLDDLDPRVYKTTMKLIRLGAKLEIGKGPGEFEKGIYCTNLTYPQVVELINKEEKILPGEIHQIDEIFRDICSYSKEYHQAKRLEGLDKADRIKRSYKESIIPRIFKLSEPARNMLKARIKARVFNIGPVLRSEVYDDTLEDIDHRETIFGHK